MMHSRRLGALAIAVLIVGALWVDASEGDTGKRTLQAADPAPRGTTAPPGVGRAEKPRPAPHETGPARDVGPSKSNRALSKETAALGCPPDFQQVDDSPGSFNCLRLLGPLRCPDHPDPKVLVMMTPPQIGKFMGGSSWVVSFRCRYPKKPG